MEHPKTRLVEEDNTIYEIDLECMRKKEQKRQQIEWMRQKKNAGCQGEKPEAGLRQDFS